MPATLLHLIAQKKLPTRGAFIHVPCTPAYVAKQSYPYHEYPVDVSISWSIAMTADYSQHCCLPSGVIVHTDASGAGTATDVRRDIAPAL
jgi:hypothetical protein